MRNCSRIWHSIRHSHSHDLPRNTVTCILQTVSPMHLYQASAGASSHDEHEPSGLQDQSGNFCRCFLLFMVPDENTSVHCFWYGRGRCTFRWSINLYYEDPGGQDPSATLWAFVDPIRLNLIDRWLHQMLRCDFCCAKQNASHCNFIKHEQDNWVIKQPSTAAEVLLAQKSHTRQHYKDFPGVICSSLTLLQTLPQTLLQNDRDAVIDSWAWNRRAVVCLNCTDSCPEQGVVMQTILILFFTVASIYFVQKLLAYLSVVRSIQYAVTHQSTISEI